MKNMTRGAFWRSGGRCPAGPGDSAFLARSAEG